MPPVGAVGAAVSATMSASQKSEHMAAMVESSRAKLQKELKREETRKHWPFLRKTLYKIVSSHHFELACGAVILINMALVVLETDAGVGESEPPAWMGACTFGLLSIYTTELVVKLYVYRIDFFHEMWNVTDFLVVGVDLVFLLISAFIEMPSISILRIFRLVKLARAFKAAKSFRELKSLLRACACALRAIFWGMLLLVMALTVWGILAVQLIHPINMEIANNQAHKYAGCERCPRAFETVFASMLTFWKQLVAGDSWGTLCEPIIEEAKWTSLFFMLVLVTVNLTMLNCILAVVVEAGAAAAAADEHDQALEREKTVVGAEGKLIDLCHGLDSDDSGSLTIEEFYEGFRSNVEFKECLELMHVTQEDMEMIFNICDEDDSGDVDYNEFVEQLRRIKHSSEQIILNYVTDVRHVVKRLRPEVLNPSRYVNSLQEKVDAPQEKDQATSRLLQPDDQTEGEAKAAASLDDNRVQLESAAGAMQEMPPEIGSLLCEPSEQASSRNKASDKANQMEDKATDQNQSRTLLGVDQIIPQSKWERIWQVNEDLVTIMKEHTEQTKVQTQLLNSIVRGLPQSLSGVTGSMANNSGRSAQPQVTPTSQRNAVQVEPRAISSVTMVASARGTESGCCGPVRIV